VGRKPPLDEALATELVCILRYKRHSFTAKGQDATAAAAEFLEHANDMLGLLEELGKA
jgi:bacterioferritin